MLLYHKREVARLFFVYRFSLESEKRYTDKCGGPLQAGFRLRQHGTFYLLCIFFARPGKKDKHGNITAAICVRLRSSASNKG
jgi:hypothetical protein